MAITFEEKSNVGKNISEILIIVALIAGIGFFGWKLFQGAQVVAPDMSVVNVKIDEKVLDDPRISSLDLFPEIPTATVGAVRENPFVKDNQGTATTSLAVAPKPKAAGSARSGK
jgi:hypothetical protein